jgi:hypothetical protein
VPKVVQIVRTLPTQEKRKKSQQARVGLDTGTRLRLECCYSTVAQKIWEKTLDTSVQVCTFFLARYFILSCDLHTRSVDTPLTVGVLHPTSNTPIRMALHRIVTMASRTAEPHAINRELIVLAIEDERKWFEEHRRESDPEYGAFPLCLAHCVTRPAETRYEATRAILRANLYECRRQHQLGPYRCELCFS